MAPVLDSSRVLVKIFDSVVVVVVVVEEKGKPD